MNYQKDPGALFSAVSILKQHGIPFKLDVCGADNEDIRNLARNAGVMEETTIHGEIPQEELAKLMRQSDALILYSRFETFGCVIIEANACGVPVLVTDTSVMRELILDGVNGLFVQPGNPAALAEKIIELHSGKYNFDREAIANTTDQYSYDNVAEKHIKLYENVLDPDMQDE
jgi:glycosyltransferase involved in cell wall biosynthesis